MVRPSTQFCCGCSLRAGATLIIGFNLVQNVFYIATATSNIILKIPTFGFDTSLTEQTLNAAFCLLGLPFIAGAIWGVMYNLEPNLRLYFAYQIASFLLYMCYLAVSLLSSDLCGFMPMVLEQHGNAFACGFMRIGALAFTSMVTVVQLYCIFTIWSLCEDMKACGAGFPDLMKGAQEAVAKRRYAAPQYEGFGGYGADAGAFPVAYGSVKSPGIGGATRILGGTYHETTYPPNPGF
mmetsp:Transcript_38031/g.104616  ORF Transcript_38031/g.104616 Transcript_38031/m.104616 type:complete len:237 (-) Transcript_38031:79-789(-)